MSSHQLDEERIFHTARKITDDEARGEYLDQICAGDHSLRERVEALLSASDQDSEFLKSAENDIEATAEHTTLDDATGQRIGPYKLLQKLGEGGFGVVYMAEQAAPIKRRVALKIIKPGMDTRQVLARFEAERQAMAMMDHPNIAKALDVGTTENGHPYFIMELVKGIPITQYCDEHRLNANERLQLLIPICLAVQHAHQKGIIHRDLKPSNILIAEYDNQPVPKIIDFGVAKALNQQLSDKTMFTQFGQVLGTLEYMSPEQAKLNQLDIDTRSDIYSLGVVLYELLVGATPFDKQRLRDAAFDELLQIIREEEPPRPSIRLSSLDTVPTIASNRKTEPRKLSLLLKGELDWIVMKALDKGRYETASAFADDIKRYLSGETVVACPPSVAYRFRKFASRNKAALATTSLVFAVLLAGLAGTAWQAYSRMSAEDSLAKAKTLQRETEKQRQIAEGQLERAEKERFRADKLRTQAERAHSASRAYLARLEASEPRRKSLSVDRAESGTE